MRDEDFSYFITKFGEATHRVEVAAEAIQRWRGRLPNLLLSYWQQEGWSGYANGLFWIVDPDDYEDLVDEWLDGTPLEQIDAFHAIGRTAFGKLFLCGERTGASVDLNCPLNAVLALPRDLRPQPLEELDWSIRSFVGGNRKAECDYNDDFGQPLFERALAKLGPLAPDEMYGFEPALVAGGKMRLENLRKLKLDQHLTILRQLAAPTLPFSKVDIDKLLKS